MIDRIKRFFFGLKQKLPYKPIGRFIERKPFTSFFAALLALFLLIFLASLFGNAGVKEVKKTTAAKSVQVYRLGENPALVLQAKIEKSGVTKIIAQSSGIVQSISVHEGDSVAQGTQLISLSTDYQGGNAASVQRQIAQATYQNTLDSYDLQKGLINSQRTVATASADNTEQLRQIAQQSLNDTQDLLSKNQTILNTLNNTPQTTPGPQAQVQQQAQVAQLENTVRSLTYQTNTNNAPTTLANAQKDATLNQLAIQEKALDLTKQTSKLQLDLASITEALMYPASPYAGVVQRVNVKVGDNVTPGTPLATVAANSQESKAVVTIPQELAGLISKLNQSTLHINNNTYFAVPTFISQEATDGSLYSATYAIPSDATNYITDGDIITIDIPLVAPGSQNTLAKNVDPFIPLDAVYQSEDSAYVFAIKNGHAKSQKITLGNVYGRYVNVTAGVSPNEKIILDRNIVDGEAVKEN